jgi:flagellar biosynthesis anti-sigma factor FlgM
LWPIGSLKIEERADENRSSPYLYGTIGSLRNWGDRALTQPEPGEKVGFSPDEVQLSVDGERVQQMQADLGGLPDLRQDRVVPLRQAVEGGSYDVSSQQIAQAMSSDLLGIE